MDNEFTVRPERQSLRGWLRKYWVMLGIAGLFLVLFYTMEPTLFGLGTPHLPDIHPKPPPAGTSIMRRGAKAADFTLPDLEGNEHRLSDYHGKVVLLNFWATWCSPCRYEIPSIEKLHQELSDEGFVILAVSLDFNERTVAKYAEREDLSFTILYDENKEVAEVYRASALPTSFVIDAEGTIISTEMGAADWAHPDFIAWARKLLMKGRPAPPAEAPVPPDRPDV